MIRVLKKTSFLFVFFLSMVTHFTSTVPAKTLDLKLICDSKSVFAEENWGDEWVEKTEEPWRNLSIDINNERCFPKGSNNTTTNDYILKHQEDFLQCKFFHSWGTTDNNQTMENQQTITIDRYTGETRWFTEFGKFYKGILVQGWRSEHIYQCSPRKRAF